MKHELILLDPLGQILARRYDDLDDDQAARARGGQAWEVVAGVLGGDAPPELGSAHCRCGHLLTAHEAGDYDEGGRMVDPICTVGGCAGECGVLVS